MTVKDQVVVRRKVHSFPTTNQIRVGTILAFQDAGGRQDDKGDFALVSFPGPGGVAKREVHSISTLEPVSERFKRSSVQINPAFRQIGNRMI